MSRPPVDPSENIVDAEVYAHAGSRLQRRFSAPQLPRLSEAGVQAVHIDAEYRFSRVLARPAVSGRVAGEVVMRCQRCMQPVSIPLQDDFQVLVVDRERNDEPEGFEPVIANASRLDLAWLAEEQLLLALPLVPLHEQMCVQLEELQPAQPVELPAPAAAHTDEDEQVRNQPFRHLGQLLGRK
jgi:uncharacterized protein